MGITAVIVNPCQWNTKHDLHEQVREFSIRALSPWIEVDIFIIRRKCKVVTLIARKTSSIFPFTTLCKVGKQLWMANTPQASASLVHHSKDNKLLLV